MREFKEFLREYGELMIEKYKDTYPTHTFGNEENINQSIHLPSFDEWKAKRDA